MDDYDGKMGGQRTDGFLLLAVHRAALGLGDLPVGECESWILARKEPDGGARRWAGQARNLMEQD